MKPLVDLVVEAQGWESALPDLADLGETAARLALEHAGIDVEGREISLLACDDDRIATLNATFRDKPAATNVLSWPASALAPPYPGAHPPEPPPGPLGDVAIALETVTREAQESGLPLKNHVLHLILHGALHLLGYDHQTDEDAVTMEGIETRALNAIGVPDPYERVRGVTGPQET